MDRAYIDSHNLIDEYARGKLSGNELEEFEVYMLEHPAIVDDIEFAKGMQDALKNSKESLLADSARTVEIDGTGGFWFGRQYAVAATVLLAVSALFSASFLLQNSTLREEIGNLRNPQIIGQEIWLEPFRSGRNPAIQRKSSLPILLHVDVSAMPVNSYVLAITEESTGFYWSISQVQADDEQLVHLLLPELPAGDYLLSVSAEMDPDILTPFAKYRFSLTQTYD